MKEHLSELIAQALESMVNAGEHAGFLGPVLQQLADYTEQRQYAGQKLKMAMIYPFILIGVAIAVVILPDEPEPPPPPPEEAPPVTVQPKEVFAPFGKERLVEFTLGRIKGGTAEFSFPPDTDTLFLFALTFAAGKHLGDAVGNVIGHVFGRDALFHGRLAAFLFHLLTIIGREGGDGNQGQGSGRQCRNDPLFHHHSL